MEWIRKAVRNIVIGLVILVVMVLASVVGAFLSSNVPDPAEQPRAYAQHLVREAVKLYDESVLAATLDYYNDPESAARPVVRLHDRRS